MLFNKKRAFIRGNAIAYLLLLICSLLGIFAIWYVDGLSVGFYIYLCFVVLLFFGSIYYILNFVYDNIIRKNGKLAKAKIVKVYDSKSRGFSIGTIIVYEYKNQDGNLIQTKEILSRSFKHFFKENDRIDIKTNGKKGLLVRENYISNFKGANE